MNDEAIKKDLAGDLLKILHHRTEVAVRFARTLIEGKDNFDTATWNATLAEAKAFIIAYDTSDYGQE